MRFLNGLAWFLIIIGALNWGLWGFFQFDFVAWFAKGNTTMLARLIYAIIGLAGVWKIGCFGKHSGCGCSCHKQGGQCGPGDSCKK